MTLTDRQLAILGWIATTAAVAMYMSYVDQIRLNLAGDKGSLIQPLAAMVNCSLWVGYGLLRRVRDWPITLANLPGIILGFAAFVTAW